MKNLIAVIFVLTPLASFAHGSEPHGDAAELDEAAIGAVHFQTSCSKAVETKFNRAVALLHSFWYAAAIDTFEDVLQNDPSCAMAEWGIALSHWGNPLATKRGKAMLAKGAEAAARGRALAAQSERERMYIDAVSALYTDFLTTTDLDRGRNYEKAMARLAAAYPDDPEATIFYAISLNGTADLLDKSYKNLLKAAELLEPAFEKWPNHPGIAHYLIHSYDVPALVERALDAARKYASIAPAAPHALHMPSHTFTRLGFWRDSIETNIRSEKAALEAGSPGEALHALDYMTYALLQTAQDSKAVAAQTRAAETLKLLDPLDRYAATGAYAAAAIPARVALERKDWETASQLKPQTVRDEAYINAITDYARGIGASHLGDLEMARAAVAALEAAEQATSSAYWSGRVTIKKTIVQARIAMAMGEANEALATMQLAAKLDDESEKSARSPGPEAPARELLGQLLLELDRPQDALAEFNKSLQRDPRKFHSVFGAALAAEQSGDLATATTFYRQLMENCACENAERPEILHARAFLQKRGT
ncbi:MAG: hypothetical protein AAF384_09345 [Pseudomonadota bacterium]